ncbi:F-box protein At3g07870-like isoform X2 [Papaver somniferum]|uniref:F-box protein At3g07870-like isoform X2 n=1 Tax=Papaver somniferum TaxID=3469 RepID=UPI000E702E3B|nr:F-box protein At3g07870-like isoform X2 [Papaver somniferum]
MNKGIMMGYFQHLPEEIILDILNRLPTETVLECKSVCRTRRSLIRHPTFSKTHLHHLNHSTVESDKLGFIVLTIIIGGGRGIENCQYFEYNENHESIDRIERLNFDLPFGWDTRILGSSNGLICLSRRLKEDKTYICNPITREYLMLPEIVKRVGMGDGAKGFGYVPSTNEYKAVTIVSYYQGKFGETYIYTLGSGNGWRNLGEFNFRSRAYQWGHGIFVNGALYWWDHLLKMIVNFDLAEEKFCEHLSPPAPILSNSDFNDFFRPCVLDGCLCFAINLRDNGATCWDVWLLKKKDDNHGIKERDRHQSLGWSKVFRIAGALGWNLFAVTKSYSVLTYVCNSIKINEPEASTSKAVVDFKEYYDQVFPHENTLVSLKELGEEDTKIMESVEIAKTECQHQPFNQL